ncbi:MAG: beta-lactamase family protein [Bryobacteraceae bacterium]|nr:beta-lactamase family protein [Bryobacteraceae bacterium]
MPIPRRTVLLFLAVASIALPAPKKPAAVSRAAEIDAAIAEFMAAGKVPGLTVSVAVDGQLRWSKGYGLADIENGVPSKASTVYRLASISKPITAVAALQLAEQGTLDLDAPIQTYLPAFPAKPWPISERALLCHLGGIRHYAHPAEIDSTRHYTDLIEPLSIFQADPLVAEPWTAYNYSTYGYLLAGAVVEAAAGRPFLELLRARVFEPAGMDRIQPDDVFAIIPNRARGYRLAPGGRTENCAPADTSNKIPGGGLVGTAEDLVKFGLAVKTGKLLKPETVELMLAPQRLRNGSETRYGLGWSLYGDGKGRLIGHSGGQQGVSTMLLMDVDRGDVVAVMANLERAGVDELSARILQLLSR